jgi:thiol:disulfide interchange protein DsbD
MMKELTSSLSGEVCRVLHYVPRLRAHRPGVLRLSALWLIVGFPCAGFSQSSDDTVRWSARVTRAPATVGANDATLELSGSAKEGWHVYAFSQLPGGPTALRVTVDDDKFARISGAPAGTPPATIHDPSFGLETHFYTHAFLVQLPLRLEAHAADEKQVPISVRFQTCNDRECQPPRTIQLAAPVDTRADRSRTGGPAL